ncbi:tyrosine--tRNA ligase [bacterium]|nr:MAG: tyrosine--tRNA ligase [bacterium]
MDMKSIITRRVAEIIDEKHLTNRLRSKSKLRVKLGIDPTGADLHLGHAVPLWKLREFQEAGHKAVFIVGDWTAMIGDPSGKDETRKALTRKEVEINARHYFDQAYLILDKSKTEVHLQSEWFKKFGLADVIHLESLVSEQQLLAHETFRARIQKGLPVRHHETLYPLLQGYDSMMVKSDVEIGAMEQKFNVLMGREVQKAYGQKPQDVMLVKYLIGLDGKEKMGKILNNYIALHDAPAEMFGKIMSLPDSLIMHYFELCTEVPEKDLQEFEKALAGKSLNPKEIKEKLGREIVTIYHGKKKAEEAQKTFETKFSKGAGEVKADFELKKSAGEYNIIDLLVEGKLASSKSEAKRKIAEGAVDVDGAKVFDDKAKATLNKKTLIRLGKRFLRIKSGHAQI